MSKITNYCKDCEAWCCYDGVYLSKADEEKIKKVVNENKNFFSFLPDDYIVSGEWEGKVSGSKTDVKPKRYKSKNYPKHFNQTTCVFSKDNKCMLEEFAVQKGEYRWKYKPQTCSVFPLQNKNGNFVLPTEKEDDCNLGEKYPGFVSFCPCYKLETHNFDDEFKHLK